MAKLASHWKPEVYLTFASYRARPVEDLLARVTVAAAGQIYDLGCGPGNVTAKLVDRWPDRSITAIDSSATMLAEARRTVAARYPSILWEEADIQSWRAEHPAALIFSNAALHWVPAHAELLPRLIAQLAPGGQLAVQMPNTADAPYKDCAHSVIASPRWRARLGAVQSHPDPLRAEAYYEILVGSAEDIDIWETDYQHPLRDLDAVVQWVSGAALVPYLGVLDDSEKKQFLADFKTAASHVYRPQSDGTVLFTMRRLFFVARRAH